MISILRLFDRHGGVCAYCGCETYVPGSAPRTAVAARFGITLGVPGAKKAMRRRMATREHIVRVADGGGDAAVNLTLACQYCNITRGAATPEEHRAAVRRSIIAGTHPNHSSVVDISGNAQWRARRAAGMWSGPSTEPRP